MALETASFISDLVSTNPTASDNISQGDDHIRLLKSTIKATFPNFTGAVSPTHTMVNTWFGSGNGTATPSASVITTPAGTGTNIAGANLTLLAGNGTGTGGSGYIAFQTASAGTTGSTANTLTERMRIDNAGNVGIGTASPTSALEVAVSATSAIRGIVSKQVNTGTQGANFNGLKARGTIASPTAAASGDYMAQLKGYGYDGSNFIETATIATQVSGTVSTGIVPSSIYFLTTDTSGVQGTRATIDSSGNVGIGTASPTYKIDTTVSGSGTTFNGLRINNGTTIAVLGTTGASYSYGGASSNEAWLYTNGYNLNIGPDGAAALKFVTNGSERARIDSSGNVGIGTGSNIAYPLEVYSTSATSRIRISGTTNYSLFDAYNNSGDLYIGIDNSTGSGFAQGNYSRVIYSSGAYPLVISTNSTERTRIDSSGYTYETNAVNTQSTAATLTAAQVLGGILVTSPSGAITLTMPTGTDLDAVFPNVTGMTRDLTVVNTTANVVTIAANTGVTLTGGMQPTSSNPCLFRLRRTGSATYTMYRAG